MNLLRAAIDRLSERKREGLARLLDDATGGAARSDDARLEPETLGDNLQGRLHVSDTRRTGELLDRLFDFDEGLARAALFDLKKDTRRSHQSLVRDFLRTHDMTGLHLPGETDWNMAREVLTRHPDEEARLAAVRLLLEINSEHARVSLALGLGDSSRKVVTTILEEAFAESSIFALWLVDRAIDRGRLDHPDWVADWFARRGSAALELLTLGWKNNLPILTGATLSALIRSEPALFTAWWDKRIGDRSDKKRREAIFCLCLLTEIDTALLEQTAPGFLARVLGIVESMIDDPVPSVRSLVLRTLANRGIASTISHARKLIADRDAGVRKTALNLINKNGHPSDIPRLLSLWGDWDDEIMTSAVKGMDQFAEKRGAWIDGVRKLLKHSDWDPRENAVRFLGVHGKPEDLESVLPLMADDDCDVCLAALNAAILLAPSRAVEFADSCLIDEDEDIVKRALEILEKELGSAETADRILASLPKAKGEGGGGPSQTATG